MNVHSVSAELATVARKTKGVVPPKLVGASTTVVGDKMYLFGGRLVVERRMLSDLYVFDLQTYTWDRLEPAPESIIPGPRYFHSADTWNNHLVIFGGMGYKTSNQAQDSLCVLNDVCFFSIAESRWLSPDEFLPSSSPQSLTPRARYAHLSSVSSDMLFIIGGQDLANGWLDDIHVYDLPSRTWVHRGEYPRHCGTYRSVALSSTLCVRNPGTEPLPPPAQRFRPDTAPSVLPIASPDTFVELPYSTPPSPTLPSEIFLYSNYNFTDVKRELEVFTPQPPSSFTITDHSNAMTGLALPPGLRFPTGAVLGTSLIIAGTYLAHSYQAFSIWSLDLISMTWSRIEPGTALATGSWCRAVLWRESNKFLVFGNREGNLVEDYNHRLLSWDHVAYIDLEAFGIYQPPAPGFGLGREAQAMGLAALEDGAFADFEIVCNDGRRIACSRKLLEDRWPWFRDQRRRYLAVASNALDISGTNPVLPLPAVPGSSEPTLPRPDPRLTPRSLHLAEPYPVTVAFMQYLYAQTLLTPLQHAPAVLSALLLLASTYDLSHLRDLVKHAMHRALSSGTQGVTGIYDVATICDCQSLRLRYVSIFKDIKARDLMLNVSV
ncbi:galactose oxidase [Hysterangium stoloniferum]|nr:galactose oxidase [Hysterangium stoloniferum]